MSSSKIGFSSRALKKTRLTKKKKLKTSSYLVGPAGEALGLRRALLVLGHVLVAVVRDEAGLGAVGERGRVPLEVKFGKVFGKRFEK